MKVNKITPQGFCGGVKQALKLVNESINDSSIVKPIYLLGQIIHNTHIINELEQKGVIVVENKSKTRLELLDEINEGTVIFSAHGVSDEVINKAKEKHLNIINATCPYVLVIHNKMKEYLDKGYTCLYIGSKNHPEVEGVIGINKDIKLITSLEDIKNLDILDDKIYVTNQTTLSIFDIKEIYDCLKTKYKNIIIDDKICNATTVRQQALVNQDKVDLCIIVGDKHSSNTKKLYAVSKDIAKVNTILVEDLAELKEYINSNNNFYNDVKTVNISSGASTPSYLVDEIIKYLEK